MDLRRCFLAVTGCLLLSSGLNTATPQTQNPQAEKDVDVFFAGTVDTIAADYISVSRMAQGKTEKRDFRITPETKVEGHLRTRVRVTVRYTTGEDGDTATLIIIRTTANSKK
jgi:hypothetical protein